MAPTIPGDPIWVIAGLSQSDGGDGVVTLASQILAVAATREAAEDVLHICSYSVDSSVIDVWIEESTLVDW